MPDPSSTGLAPDEVAWTPRQNAGWVYEDRIDVVTTALDWYARRYRHSTGDEWRARFVAGQIRRDGEPLSAHAPLRPGDRLEYHRPPWTEPPAPRQFALLHRDTGCLAVAKPPGLQVLPAAGFLENTLLHVVRQRCGAAWSPAHRLGRGTSGIVLFTRGEAASGRVAADFRQGRLRKLYRALVQGTGLAPAFDIDQPIGAVDDAVMGRLHVASAHGRPALSRVRLVETRSAARVSLVEVEIPTGRPHQIRIHLAAAGHPLVGDPLYVAGGVRGDLSARPGDLGYRLHAAEMTLRQPDGGVLQITCRPPAILRAAGE